MNHTSIKQLAAQWTSLGAMFNVPPSKATPDLERLLLDTARMASTSIPQFVMAITWLSAYGELVARHRLVRLITEELEPVFQPNVGLLLDTVVQLAPRHAHRFQAAISSCTTANPPAPLLEIDQKNRALRRLAEMTASPISRKWGRWLAPVELKADALRPAEWIAKHHATLALRALVGGDLVASILAEASADSQVFRSEVDLARLCGASRPAIREAVAKLRLAGFATQQRNGRRNEIVVKTAQN